MNIKELNYPVSVARRASALTITAGATVSVVVLGALAMLGLAIEAVHLPPDGVIGELGLRSTTYLAASGFAAFFAGGWIASRLEAAGRPSDSVIYGVVTWAAASLGLLLLLPFIDLVVSPVTLTLASGPGANAFGTRAVAFMACECAGACVGAFYGTRLMRPVSIDEYQRTRKHGPAAAPRA